MRYVIYGAGAIGGTIAARLHQAGRETLLIARGEHLRTIERDGLRFRTPADDVRLPVPAFDGPRSAGVRPGDVVVLTMKGQDTLAALTELAGATDSEQVDIVCAQNGIENERVALRFFPRVYGMFVYLAAEHLRPGEVLAFSEPCPGVLDLGAYPDGSDDTAERIAADLAAAGFISRAVSEIMPWKHAKLLSNLANAIGAILGPGADAGDLLDRAREEALRCYQAAGIEAVDREQVQRRAADVSPLSPIDGHAHEGSSSAQSLQRQARSVESDYLNGEIALLGRLHGVPTPVNAALAQLARRMARAGLRPGALDGDAIARELAGAR